jgi:hypothetical protein
MNAHGVYFIYVAVGVLISLLTLGVDDKEVRAQPDISLVSQRYIEESFSNQIVGEVLNNGTEAAEFVEATASFYDANGQIVGTEYTFADPSTVQQGTKSPFTISIISETINNEAASYSITLQWQDSEGNDFSKLVLENDPISTSPREEPSAAGEPSAAEEGSSDDEDEE